MRLQAAFLLLASVVPSSWAIFVDEAYHTDYHHALLGTPKRQNTFFHKPTTSSAASLLYTLSEKYVLGAVNPKDGSVVWRQYLADSAQNNTQAAFLRAADGQDTVISAVGSDIFSWGALEGKLSWEKSLENGPVRDLEILAEESPDDQQRDAIILSGHKKGVVRRIDGSFGNTKWKHVDDRYGMLWS